MSELILYIDGKPVAVSNDLELTIPKPNDYVSCTTGTDQTFTVNGLFEPELPEDRWYTAWYYSKYLSRKKKKAFRKVLLKMKWS